MTTRTETTLPGAAGAMRFPSCGFPFTYSALTPCSAPSVFSMVM